MLSILALFALSATALAEIRYDGYKLIRVVPRSNEQLDFLHNVMINSVGVDFWTEPRNLGHTVDILLPPSQFSNVTTRLTKLRLAYELAVDDIQDSIAESRSAIMERRAKAGSLRTKAFDLENFNTLADIETWMDELSLQCRSDITCQVYSIGKSFEGRDIKVFKISKFGFSRKAYYIDGTTHAREWLATATTLKLLDHLVRGLDLSALYLTETYDFYFIPVVNPDGYEYSWTNDRLWRKNRSVQNFNCRGVDLNRNFGTWTWGKEGTRDNPCSDMFHGPDPNSESETLAVANELVRLGPTLQATVSIHAYAYMWIFPWGNSVNFDGKQCQLSDDHEEVLRVANAAADATQNTYRTDTWYRGNSCQTIYPTTGSTDDFAKERANVKYNFCIEVRGNSFVALPSQIDLSFREIYNGIVAMNRAIER